MLVYYEIANVAVLKIPPGQKKYPRVVAWPDGAGCAFLMIFFNPVPIAIGLTGLVIGSLYYLLRVRQNHPRPS
jgi:hypothetical protein